MASNESKIINYWLKNHLGLFATTGPQCPETAAEYEVLAFAVHECQSVLRSDKIRASNYMANLDHVSTLVGRMKALVLEKATQLGLDLVASSAAAEAYSWTVMLACIGHYSAKTTEWRKASAAGKTTKTE